jgi:hypothetical protein
VSVPEREIRAAFGPDTITVYQAFSNEIADSALKHQTFVSPPFSMDRMTWIKPSFLWMMYRSGWGRKDQAQQRILGIDITHEGFAWAMAHSCPSHPEPGVGQKEWRALMDRSPVRVQWDPERDLQLRPLPHRTIQIGLSGEAVRLYVSEWIVRISDLTDTVSFTFDLVRRGELKKAHNYLPRERSYSIGMNRRAYIAAERERLLDPSHFEHDEIVGLLQDYPENESVPYLRRAIALKPSLSYLDYDDYGAFYKKCLWALQDIATPEALALIHECAASNDASLKAQAKYRLRRIAEGGRGGTQYPKTS